MTSLNQLRKDVFLRSNNPHIHTTQSTLDIVCKNVNKWGDQFPVKVMAYDTCVTTVTPQFL